MRMILCALLCLPHLGLPHLALANEETGRWSYDGDTDPAHWGDLGLDFATCKLGRMQSPIDLARGAAQGDLHYQTDYQPVPLTIWNTGRTIMLPAKGAGVLTEGGQDFALLQVHFHTPSEHLLDGKSYPAEIHLVHQAAVGRLSVLGVFVEEGEHNPAFDQFLKHIPAAAGAPVLIPDGSFDPAELLPEKGAIHRYVGSLTTPPCSESVAWHVLAQPIGASGEQIAALSSVMGHNNRPVQPLNDRLLVHPMPEEG